ncbi:MAG: hypothetical protein QF733_04925 [Phycisphaerales bacterium]|nr:hypothetical protein [Phycisphaerales bacterium]
MSWTAAALCCGMASAVVPDIQASLAQHGGALVIPLRDASGQSDVRLTDGPRLRSQVVWLEAAPTPQRHWTLPPRSLQIHTTPTPNGSPYLLVKMPLVGEGNLLVDGSEVALHWATFPASMPHLRLDSSAEPEQMDGPWAAPPIADPSQAWRCELIASFRGGAQPTFDGLTELERVIAIASLGPWRLAMHRVASADLGVARRVAELLTGVARLDGRPVAAWLTSNAPLQEFLALAVTEDPGEPLSVRAARWCDRQTDLLTWIEEDQGDDVVLGFANPRPVAALAEVTWAVPGELPWPAHIPAASVQRRRYEPLPLRGADQLAVQVGAAHLTLPVDRSAREVTPPGLTIGPLYPTRTLSDVAAATPPPPPPTAMQTFAQVRRLMGHWELMLECRWPARPASTQGEAVTITWTCGEHRHALVATPDGLAEASAATAHTSVHEHAWLCRIVLPDAWICGTPTLSLARTHAGHEGVETWPTPATPWSSQPDPAMLDLSRWDE